MAAEDSPTISDRAKFMNFGDMIKSRLFETVSVQKAEVIVLKARIDTPVRTSFGTMHYRPSVLVRLIDRDGAEGWGEIWCNFPHGGAPHRARIVSNVLIPILSARNEIPAPEVFAWLTQKTHVLKIQSGEPGPLAQAIAGFDIAVWDLIARKTGRPLYRLFSDRPTAKVPVYASGINPDRPLETISDCRNKGFNAFKLKVGFGEDVDLPNIYAAVEELKGNEALMLDANQAWNLSEATHILHKIGELPIRWLEEPLPADRPDREWELLSSSFPIPLALGENIRGLKRFTHVISAGHVSVIQPDACKWGGITGCLEVAKLALESGRRYCPHYLGGGIGLMASAHLLAAVGGDGLLEVDVNPNPLREGLAMPFPELEDGFLTFPGSSGLGVKPDMEELKGHIEEREQVDLDLTLTLH